jgi:cytochrome c peroxidase
MNGRRVSLTAAALALGGLLTLKLVANVYAPNLQPFPDSSGVVRTFSLQGAIDLSNPFFKKLGTNGRSCSSCHVESDGLSISTAHLQQRFQISQGLDPIFRAVDGANCPSADVSTLAARTSAYSLLLNRGVIRMSLRVPNGAEFTIVAIDDPYGCPETTTTRPALYRRPLPATNLRFLPAIMWDGREPNLATQAKNATLVHAQPKKRPTNAKLEQIVDFETSLFTAQSADNLAGTLSAQGGRGGPIFLAKQAFHPGINPDGTNVFKLYSKWAGLAGSTSSKGAARAAIARGEDLFNNRPINIANVPGFNDVREQLTVMGTCGTCHNAPNVGSSSTPTMMDIGTSSPTPDLPSYTLRCNDSTQVVTTDPGRALITGKCADIGKVKMPNLRGLAARAPYFHNGSAATIMEVLNFYDQRFNMLLTDDEKADLIAFLNSL